MLEFLRERPRWRGLFPTCTSPIMHLICPSHPPPPPTCCISIVFNLSWNEKQSLCKVGGGGQIRCNYRRCASGEWKLRYISNRKRLACLHSLRGAGSIRDRRETKSRVCITVEISLKPSSVYIRLCKYRKKVFYCFYKLISPQKKPRKTPCCGTD